MHKDKGVTYLWFSLSWQRYIWPYKTSLRMAHSSTTHDQLTDLDEICFNFWQHVTIFLLTLPHTVPIDFKVWGKILRERKDIMPINKQTIDVGNCLSATLKYLKNEYTRITILNFFNLLHIHTEWVFICLISNFKHFLTWYKVSSYLAYFMTK